MYQQSYPPPAGAESSDAYHQQQQYAQHTSPVPPHQGMYQQPQYNYQPNPVVGGIPIQHVGIGAYNSGYTAPPYVVQPGHPQAVAPGYPGALPTYVVAPPVVPLVELMQWSTGLCDCLEDPVLALTACLFPCVTFGQIAEIIDSGQTSCGSSGTIYFAVLVVIGLPCLMSCGYRTRLRAKYGLIETPLPDWITHCFFECCALVQEYRELKNRGLDPAIGWYASMARQQNAPQRMMTPPMQQTML